MLPVLIKKPSFDQLVAASMCVPDIANNGLSEAPTLYLAIQSPKVLFMWLVFAQGPTPGHICKYSRYFTKIPGWPPEDPFF